MRIILDLSPFRNIINDTEFPLYLTIKNNNKEKKYILIDAKNVENENDNTIFYKNVLGIKSGDIILVGDGETTQDNKKNYYQRINNIKIYGYIVTTNDINIKNDLLLETIKVKDNMYKLDSNIDITFLNKNETNQGTTCDTPFLEEINDNYLVFGTLFIIVIILIIVLGVAQYRQKSDFYV